MPQFNKIRVVARSSTLAMIQANEVFSFFPQLEFEINPLSTYGDEHQEISLIENSIPDLFTRELDNELLCGNADIAVHSAKDLPYPLHGGLEIIALTAAKDKTEALVSYNNLKLTDLPQNPRIGTSSATRKKEILKIRPDAQIVSIRGCIADRMELVGNGTVDAIIVATCALKRLGLEKKISEILPFSAHALQGHLAIVAPKNKPGLKTIFSTVDVRRNYGKISLVGFGPGDPELLTLKAHKLLARADIIFYDDLINSEFLKNFTVEQIYVGKRKGNHSYEQDLINQMLYEQAIAGKTVVRLKGGDPFIFGRGGEELQYLQERLIEVEVIPGITSAIAAACNAKIPLTQRNISSSVAFCSGHSEGELHIPQTDTLVFYMCASNLQHIVEQILKSGKQGKTPLAIIRNASMPNEEVYISSLEAVRDTNLNFPSPIIIIVGNTINLNHTMGRKTPKVLVTGTNADLYSHLGEVVHTPLIELNPLDSYVHCDSTMDNLSDFNWIIFTSQHTVNYFFSRLDKIQNRAEQLRGCKIASIGKTTSKRLLFYGIVPDIEPSEESSEGLLEAFGQHNIRNQKILIPRSNIATTTLPKGLEELDNQVTPMVLYKNEMPKNVKKLELHDFDIVVFTSVSCVSNFLSIYGNVPAHLKIIVKGKETGKKIKQLGLSFSPTNTYV